MGLTNLLLLILLKYNRSQLRNEVDMLNSQLDKVNLAKSIAESKLSDFDRYKSMIELEITEMLARHKSVMTERVAKSAQVSLSFEVMCDNT